MHVIIANLNTEFHPQNFAIVRAPPPNIATDPRITYTGHRAIISLCPI